MTLRRLRRDDKGVALMEFALVAPVFILLVIGIAQLGLLYFANAGLDNALAEGSRHATLYPRPTEAEVKQKIQAARFGLEDDRLTIAPFVQGTANGLPYYDITMRYAIQLNFVFFDTAPITLERSRRVYIQPEFS